MEGNSTVGSFTPLQQFSVADLVVVVAYFSLNLAVGIWVRVFLLFSFCFPLPSFKIHFFPPSIEVYLCCAFCILCCICSVLLCTPSAPHRTWKDSSCLRTRWAEAGTNFSPILLPASSSALLYYRLLRQMRCSPQKALSNLQFESKALQSHVFCLAEKSCPGPCPTSLPVCPAWRQHPLPSHCPLWGCPLLLVALGIWGAAAVSCNYARVAELPLIIQSLVSWLLVWQAGFLVSCLGLQGKCSVLMLSPPSLHAG